MSKIDNYNYAKQTLQQVRSNLYHATGRDLNGLADSRNDKHRFKAHFTQISSGNWNEAVFNIHASYGYYGSSSGYDAMDKDTARYIEKAMNCFMNKIADKAIELAELDCKKAAEEAAKEASEVLSALNPELLEENK